MPRKKQKVSIFSLAKEFNCTAGSISKALSNSIEVSEEFRRKIRARADALGFRPNRPRRRNFNLCMLLDIEFETSLRIRGYQEAVMEGVYAFCKENGLEFSLLVNSTAQLEKLALTKEFYLRNADATIIVGASGNRAYFADLDKNLFPYCCVHDGPQDRTITVDNTAAGRLAFEHLYGLGHRHIAIARQLARRVAGISRFMGFLRAAAHVELAPDAIIELLPPSEDAGYAWGREILDSWCKDGKPYTAIFCLSENVAVGILSEAALRDVRIPRDLSVITCDDLEICAVAAPPLTTVDIPNHHAGYEAARFIWTQLQGSGRVGLPDMLPVENVVVRQSTGPASKP
jgi:DNA-binding LacI/PurR family transcriptional regulator